MDATSVEALGHLEAVTKQLLSLSTGVLAFTVTFLGKISTDERRVQRVSKALRRMWLSQGMAIAAGLITLLIITGQLGHGTADVYAGNLRVVFGLQLLFFGIGALYLWRVGEALIQAMIGEPNQEALSQQRPASGSSDRAVPLTKTVQPEDCASSAGTQEDGAPGAESVAATEAARVKS